MKYLIHSSRLVAAALMTFGTLACNRGEAGETSAPLASYATVQRRDLDVKAEATGQIEPIRLVEVKSKASGEIIALYVDTGDEVERGTLLVDVDPRDVQNALEQAEADHKVAEARFNQSERQLQRNEELLSQGVITQQEYENAQLDFANQQASFTRAEANLELAQERRNDVTIRAPIAGTVISRSVEEGTVIASASQNVSGGTVLMQMADLAQVQIRALVDETDLGRVEVGQETQVIVDAYPDQIFVGAVAKVEPLAVVEQNVTMFPVIIELDNQARLLKPGMNVALVFNVAQRSDALTIPNAAVINTRDAVAFGENLGVPAELVQAALDSRPALPAQGLSGDASAVAGDQDQVVPDSMVERIREQREEGRGNNNRGGRGRGGRGGGRNAGSTSPILNTRAALVFVSAPDGSLEPRRVVLGVNDWDYTEVLQGLEEGENVLLVSVSLMARQQEQQIERMVERQTEAMTGRGNIPGSGGGRGGGGRGGR